MHIDLGERFDDFDSSVQLEDVVHDDSCIAWNLIFAFAIVVVKSSCHGLQMLMILTYFMCQEVESVGSKGKEIQGLLEIRRCRYHNADNRGARRGS